MAKPSLSSQNPMAVVFRSIRSGCLQNCGGYRRDPWPTERYLDRSLAFAMISLKPCGTRYKVNTRQLPRLPMERGPVLQFQVARRCG